MESRIVTIAPDYLVTSKSRLSLIGRKIRDGRAGASRALKVFRRAPSFPGSFTAMGIVNRDIL